MITKTPEGLELIFKNGHGGGRKKVLFVVFAGKTAPLVKVIQAAISGPPEWRAVYRDMLRSIAPHIVIFFKMVVRKVPSAKYYRMLPEIHLPDPKNPDRTIFCRMHCPASRWIKNKLDGGFGVVAQDLAKIFVEIGLGDARYKTKKNITVKDLANGKPGKSKLNRTDTVRFTTFLKRAYPRIARTAHGTPFGDNL